MNRTTMVQSFLDQSLQPVAIYDRHLEHFVDCNQKLLKLLGYQDKEVLLSIPLLDYLYKEQFDGLSPQELVDAILNYFEHQEVFMTSVLVLKKDGSIILLEMCALRNYIEQNHQTIFFFKEVDEKYLAQKAVLEKNLIYKSIIQKAFDYIDIHEIVITNRAKYQYEGFLVDRSESMKTALGINNESLISLDAMAKVTPISYLKKNEEYIRPIIGKLMALQNVQFDWEFLQANGTVNSLNVSAKLVQVREKLILVRIMRDTTTRVKQARLIQKQNSDLILKNQRLEAYIESNMQLENFAYVASHDIKAPLRTINSFANVLFKKVEKNLSDAEKDLFKFIIKGSKDLSLIVDDLLNFSKVSNKKISSDIIEVETLLSDIRAKLAVTLEEQKVDIQINENIPTLFMGDYLKIFRVFQNLIQNSIKFSKPDTPAIITIEGDEDDDYWYFTVEDNGIGIKKEFQQAIFLMFRKLNGQKYTGTGIGLSLCKKIIEQHQGAIEVSSTYGKGTKFLFSVSKHIISKNP